MSVEVRIKQKGIIKKKLDLTLIKEICEKYELSFGVMNEAMTLNYYTGGNDIKEVYFTLYNPKRIGRGFDLMVEKNLFDCYMRVTTPSTNEDIATFYSVVKYISDILHAATYEKDDSEILKVSDITEEEEFITKWNAGQLLDMVSKNQNLTLFGAIYPISLEPEIVQQWIHMDRIFLMTEFADYLHEKQDADYYYARALLFKNKEEEIFGTYAITEGVETVFPLTPRVSVVLGIELKDVSYWRVSIGKIVGDGYETAGNMDFAEFAEKYQLDKKPHFDYTNVIINLTSEDIDNLLTKR